MNHLRWAGVFVCLVTSCALLRGQVTTGTIAGTARDGTGAVMPGVAVNLQNADTGMGRAVVTDSRGYYLAPNLPLGNYEVTASLAGFQTEVRRGITLNVGQNAIIDITLQVGSVTERVEVTAEAPLIETTSATVSGLVSGSQVQDLPLNARNLISLGTLQAGVAFSETGETSASKGLATKLTISGTRYNSSVFQLDGANINDATGSAGSATGILMGAETVREFSVIVNAYSAEFGQHSGGVFNAVTKSGTNSLHGSVFEFFRNDNLDAARWEENKLGDGKPEFKRNQFGGSLGGPIIKDRSFFFGSYEGLRANEGRVSRTFVPDADLRDGRVPGLTSAACTAASGVVLASGRCQLTVASTVRPYLDFYPQPTPGGAVTEFGTAARIDTWHYPDQEDFVAVRIDHKISDKDSLFGRYTFDEGSKTAAANFVTTTSALSRNQYVALGETRMFSPSVINQLVLGFSRSNISDGNAELTTPDLVIPPQFNWVGRPGPIKSPGVPEFSAFGGAGGSTSDLAQINALNSFQVRNDVSYVRERHSLKFGFNFQRLQFKYQHYFNGMGTYSFASIPDFVQGIVNNFTALRLEAEPVVYWRHSLYGFYAQDDFRVSPRLTLNLGVRYEFITTPFEKHGRVSNLKDFTLPGQTFADLVIDNPTFFNPSLKNFAPRVGLSWDPTGSGKTSIRAGAGIFHDQINVGAYLFGFLSSPPFYEIGAIAGRGVARFPDAFFTQQNLLRANSNLEGFEYEPSQPTIFKWSLDVQRELTPNTGVTVGYSGTRGVHVIRVISMNSRIAQQRGDRGLFIPTTAPFLSPAFARIRPRFADVTSDYHALRLSVQKRLSAGLQFQSAYTWSKTVDDASNFTGGSDFGNAPGSARHGAVKDRGLAAFDLRHVMVNNFSYQLPGSRLSGAAGKVLGGWQMSGIISLRSGSPFDVSTGVSPAHFRNGFISDYPDVAAGTEYQYDTRNPDRYFDASGFLLPPGYSTAERTALGGSHVGNAGRAILIGPGSATIDFVLMKTMALTERLGLQFRSEFFNLFNRANFSAPTGRIFADANTGAIYSRQGEISGTRGSARQIQFGLRLEF
ncbi:MAG: TonB-dependent receptor [Acidobacteria bacterium]|nr:TonB-dependent receptor [Acidobacteriota bacterium]